ncbi:unnamed protein product [Pylaiella littoralis]
MNTARTPAAAKIRSSRNNITICRHRSNGSSGGSVAAPPRLHLAPVPPILPRRPLSKGNKREILADIAERIPVELMRQYFNYPLRSAAEAMHISVTTLKRLCRRHGVKRWPHRQISGINRALVDLESQHDAAKGGEAVASVVEELRELHRKREVIIEKAFDSEDESTRNKSFDDEPAPPPPPTPSIPASATRNRNTSTKNGSSRSGEKSYDCGGGGGGSSCTSSSEDGPSGGHRSSGSSSDTGSSASSSCSSPRSRSASSATAFAPAWSVSSSYGGGSLPAGAWWNSRAPSRGGGHPSAPPSVVGGGSSTSGNSSGGGGGGGGKSGHCRCCGGGNKRARRVSVSSSGSGRTAAAAMATATATLMGISSHHRRKRKSAKSATTSALPCKTKPENVPSVVEDSSTRGGGATPAAGLLATATSFVSSNLLADHGGNMFGLGSQDSQQMKDLAAVGDLLFGPDDAAAAAAASLTRARNLLEAAVSAPPAAATGATSRTTTRPPPRLRASAAANDGGGGGGGGGGDCNVECRRGCRGSGDCDGSGDGGDGGTCTCAESQRAVPSSVDDSFGGNVYSGSGGGLELQQVGPRSDDLAILGNLLFGPEEAAAAAAGTISQNLRKAHSLNPVAFSASPNESSLSPLPWGTTSLACVPLCPPGVFSEDTAFYGEDSISSSSFEHGFSAGLASAAAAAAAAAAASNWGGGEVGEGDRSGLGPM